MVELFDLSIQPKAEALQARIRESLRLHHAFHPETSVGKSDSTSGSSH